ncbi:MAG: FtsX-like permease family protein [Gammaproteobacteria bacterium]|nr:FtsX-like permease family protein [Gammaproteobacteria bacterium]
MSGLLTTAGLRFLRRHPWQTWLTILGVALGVGVVVAVDLANESARRAFALSLEGLVGRATHHVVGPPDGFDDQVYRELRVVHRARPSAPVVEGYLRNRGAAFHLIGVDPFAERPFRDATGDRPQGDLARLLTEPNSVLLGAPSARRLDIGAGDTLVVDGPGGKVQLTVVGLLEGPRSAAYEGVLAADIATAQEVLQRVGRLDRIDLIADDAAIARLAPLLPPGLRIEPAARRQAALAQMTAAFELNLQAMGLLALVVGALLVYNTMTFSVLRRRAVLGTLRLIGATRRQVFWRVLAESLLLGLIGGLIGLALGVAVGSGLVRLVTRTINDLYFTLTVTAFAVSPALLAKGLLLGLGSAALAAAGPAWEAAHTEPAAARRRASLERRTHGQAPWLALGGTALLGTGLGLTLVPDRGLVLAFTALFLVILGYSLVVPGVLVVLARAFLRPAGALFGTAGRLALRAVDAGLSRTGVAVAALCVAVAATVGVGVMVESFRDTVARWLGQTLRADLYVSAPGTASNRTDGVLPAEVPERLRSLPGVRGISKGRTVQADGTDGPVLLLAVELGPDSHRGFDFKGPAPPGLWEGFAAGELVLASEPYAWRRAVGVGDAVVLHAAQGPRRFRIGGVFRDYGTDRGMLVIDRAAYAQAWNDPAVSTVGVFLADPADLDAALGAVQGQLADLGQALLVRANRAIREQSLAIFDRTFAITGVLRLLAIGVAFIGILSALMALQLERGREHAVLRALGLTPGQLVRLGLIETGAMGLLAGLLALPLGWALAELLIHVVNRRSFGWSMDSLLPPGVLFQAVALAVAAALLAGLFPALRMARARPAAALRDE